MHVELCWAVPCGSRSQFNRLSFSFNVFIPKGDRGPVGPTGPFGETGPRVSRGYADMFCFFSDSLKSPEVLFPKYGSL